jgi:hypothetical protein
MDCYEAMMKADRQFVRFVRLMFNPVSSVIEQGRNFRGDKVRPDANIALSFPILSCPNPELYGPDAVKALEELKAIFD